MREILFRGKRSTDGKWVYGDYHQFTCTTSGITPTPTYYIVGTNASNKGEIWVDGTTICEYTGEIDKNGAKIFESDIVSVPWNKNGRKTMTGLVEFAHGAFSIVWQDKTYGKHFVGYVDDIEVIGNIFDNPEAFSDSKKIEFCSTYCQKEIEQMIARHLTVPLEWVKLGVVKKEIEIDGKKYDQYTPALAIHGYQ